MKMLVATRIPFLVLKRQGWPGAAVAPLLLAVNPAAVAAGRILNHALRRAGAGSQAMAWPDPEELLMLPCTCPQCGTNDARKVLADGRASHSQPQRPRSGPGGGALEPVLVLQALWRTVSVAGLNAVQAVVLSHLSKDDPWLLIPKP